MIAWTRLGKTCLYERMLYTAWFDDEHSSFLDQRKETKILWLQDPNRSNADSLNNV